MECSIIIGIGDLCRKQYHISQHAHSTHTAPMTDREAIKSLVEGLKPEIGPLDNLEPGDRLDGILKLFEGIFENHMVKGEYHEAMKLVIANKPAIWWELLATPGTDPGLRFIMSVNLVRDVTPRIGNGDVIEINDVPMLDVSDFIVWFSKDGAAYMMWELIYRGLNAGTCSFDDKGFDINGDVTTLKGQVPALLRYRRETFTFTMCSTEEVPMLFPDA